MNQKNKRYESYLKEDSDLLTELESVKPQPSGYMSDTQKHQLSSIQTKATLRSRKTMIDLDDSNKQLQIGIGIFAFIQIAIAGLQLLLEIKIFPDPIYAFFIGVSLLVVLYGGLKLMGKREK